VIVDDDGGEQEPQHRVHPLGVSAGGQLVPRCPRVRADQTGQHFGGGPHDGLATKRVHAVGDCFAHLSVFPCGDLPTVPHVL